MTTKAQRIHYRLTGIDWTLFPPQQHKPCRVKTPMDPTHRRRKTGVRWQRPKTACALRRSRFNINPQSDVKGINKKLKTDSEVMALLDRNVANRRHRVHTVRSDTARARLQKCKTSRSIERVREFITAKEQEAKSWHRIWAGEKISSLTTHQGSKLHEDATAGKYPKYVPRKGLELLDLNLRWRSGSKESLPPVASFTTAKGKVLRNLESSSIHFTHVLYKAWIDRKGHRRSMSTLERMVKDEEEVEEERRKQEEAEKSQAVLQSSKRYYE